jgi:hypothetical protein
MKYNVLWIDDECNNTGKHFIGLAEQYHIDIISFESHEEGIDYLDKNLKSLHAVILDAKVKLKKEDTVTSLEGLTASRDKLIEINSKFYLPYFIYTGQPDYMKNEIFKNLVGDYYVKGEDNERLIKDIIDKSSQLDEMITRKEFEDAFKCFDRGILNENSKKLFLKITKNLRNQNYRKENINTQRDFYESLLLALNKTIPCIPDFCFSNDGPNLEWCTKFLEDRGVTDKRGHKWKLNKTIPKDIKAAIRKLKESSSNYSHLKVEGEFRFQFIANTYIILEILDWLTGFVEEHYKNYI